MFAVSFRFFFSLKATRVFGPFTKLIKINAFSLVPWVFVTALDVTAGESPSRVGDENGEPAAVA